ncbi:sigma-70 family RNA polymerase sigma factor [Paenibacillus sp. GCM10023250]|uniref:sigma-70 family RNA polymerase sigma factor n=1 Tax=Paenibacillus sp. GCM10023250 TaxID=3252648 RepID=UPI0036208EA8
MDEAKEVRRAQQGDAQSFARLIQAHKTVMYQVAKTILKRDADCADAIQEAIVKAFEKIGTLREAAYFKTWLLRILINECNRIHRQRKTVVALDRSALPAARDHGYEQVELDQLLGTLPDEESRLLELYYLDDISVKVLAELYRKPENTIKTWLRRARGAARRIWGEQEGYTWKNGSDT